MPLPKFASSSSQDIFLAALDKKIAFSFALLLFFLMVIVLSASGFYFQKAMAREERMLVAMVTHTIDESIAHVSSAGAAHVRMLVEDLGKYPGIAYVIVTDRNHRVIAASDAARNNTRLDDPAMHQADKVFAGQKQVIQELTVGGTRIREVDMPYRRVPANDITGVIRVGISMQDKIDAVRRGFAYITLLVLLLLVLGVIFA